MNDDGEVTDEEHPGDVERVVDSGEAPEPEEDSIAVLLEQFEARIEGLVDLVDALSPHVLALDGSPAIEDAISQAGFTDGGQEIARLLMLPPDVSMADKIDDEGHVVETTEVDASNGNNGEVSFGDGQVGAGVDSESGTEADSESGTEADSEKLAAEFADVFSRAVDRLSQLEPEAFLKAVRRSRRRQIASREELLNGSLLTVAVATFENLLAGLFREHLIRFPRQLESEDKEFSLRDLLEHGSVDEARRVLIERRTDGFMRGGFVDWSEWAQRTLKVSFEDLAADGASTNEVFQRRHLVVHTGGVVTQIYLDRVDFEGDEAPDVGSLLKIDADYLRQAIDAILVLGVALAARSLSKWGGDHGPKVAATRVISCTYDLMQEGRWAVVQPLCKTGCELGQPEAQRWVMTVNGWVATRALTGASACAEEIANWDVSALDPKFVLAKAALQDDRDRVIELLPATLEAAGVEAKIIPNWPVLRPFREDPEFIKIVTDAGARPASDSESSGEADSVGDSDSEDDADSKDDGDSVDE
jgi:hypothetical protein